eukprot:7390553-Pyramimonas_sp.AAC.1
MQEARIYSHDEPIICRKRGYILTTNQSYAGNAGGRTCSGVSDSTDATPRMAGDETSRSSRWIAGLFATWIIRRTQPGHVGTISRVSSRSTRSLG